MKSATVERIRCIRAHPNADRLDLVTVRGFQCVTSRNSFQENQLIIFIQPDSVLPNDQEWSQPYLKYARPRVRAMKIRDQWSEGLIIPLNENLNEGDDLTEKLGIQHYEAPISQDSESIIGPLPLNIPKTDEERFENVQDHIPWNQSVDVTLKIDGTSCSFYYYYPLKKFGICARNHEYDLNKSSLFASIAKKYNIEDILSNFCEEIQRSLVIRGELYGNGIQNKSHNPHCKQTLQWAMFSVYFLDEPTRYARKSMDDLFYSIRLAEHLKLPHVPIVESDVLLTKELVDKYSSNVDLSFGEGVVVQHDEGSFKILNKNYDAKN